MRTSNYKLSTLKTAAQEKVDYVVGDGVVARAANHALKIYKKFERRAKMQFRYEQVSIGASGLALSLIGTSNLTDWATSTAYAVGDVVEENDLGYVCVEAHTSGTFATDLAADKWEQYFPLENEEDIRIFRADSAGKFNRPSDEVIRAAKNSQINGYYIENEKIYLTPEATTANDYVIEYHEAHVPFSVSTVDLNQFLPIDKYAEEFFEEFVLEKFFRTKGLMAHAQDAEAKYIEKLREFFADKDLKAVYLSPHHLS